MMNVEKYNNTQKVSISYEELMTIFDDFRAEMRQEVNDQLNSFFRAFDRKLYKAELAIGGASKELEELRTMVDEVYLPIKRERQAAARARLMARAEMEEDEEDC